MEQTVRRYDSRVVNVWIGLVGVIPVRENTCLVDAKGAYVNALALVSSSEEYEETVAAALGEFGLFAFEFEDVEPISDRMSRVQIAQSLRELADETRRSGQVRFDDFHTFKHLDS